MDVLIDEERPTSNLQHYTSLGVVLAMLNNALNAELGPEQDAAPELLFHATNLYKMNDAGEGRVFYDKFFTDSGIKREYAQIFEGLTEEHGSSYSLSFSQTGERPKQNGHIPMWKMYGDDFKGAMLVFDRSKMWNHWHGMQERKELMTRCNYLLSTDVQARVQYYNGHMRDANDADAKKRLLFNMMQEVPFIKRNFWEYEQEYRIVAWRKGDEAKFKQGASGLVDYIELPIPLKSLKHIVVGQFAGNKKTLDTLEFMQRRLQVKYGEEHVTFNVYASNLKLQ